MFELGGTFGFMQSFSILFSLIMFQWSSGAMTPLVLWTVRKKLTKLPKILTDLICSFMVLWMVTFPYIVGWIPFYVFFDKDRTQWLKDNDFIGFDWN